MGSLFRYALSGLIALVAAPAFADISIGHVLPLSGPQGARARELSAGAKAYIDKVNAAGGMYGHKIRYVVRDDGGLSAQTLVRADELITRERVFGLLEGASPANVAALLGSGTLRQHNVPMLGVKHGIGSPADLTGAQQAGLVEIAAPEGKGADQLLTEFRDAMRRFGPPNQSFGDAALQGYIAAKVMVGAVRLLGPKPTHEDFYRAVRYQVPAVSRPLALSTQTRPQPAPVD